MLNGYRIFNQYEWNTLINRNNNDKLLLSKTRRKHFYEVELNDRMSERTIVPKKKTRHRISVSQPFILMCKIISVDAVIQ